MASTYSNLKLQLMGTGDNATTWGGITNINIGAALDAAIANSTSIAFSDADRTLTWIDDNSPQDARFVRLNLTGTAAGGYNLIVPVIGGGKPYIINNGTNGTITVKNTTGTGVAVPAGKTMWVYNNGTNVVDVVTHLTSLTLGTALPTSSGGTGSTSTTYCNLQANVAGTLPILNGGTGTNSTTYCNLQANVTGILPLERGGTGQNTAPLARTALGATTVGGNMFTLTNPSAVTFLQINADNTVSALDAASFRTAIGAGSATGGTVTGVSFTGGIVTVTNPNTTPSLTIAGTSGGIPYFSGAATWATSALLAANAIVVGGGAGAAPATITTGANVVTALGVAVGSAGAFVTNGGALGTPSSGTLTNCSFPTLNQNTTGSAATLTTARTLTIGATGQTFNGSANVTWTLTQIGAAASGANTDITALDQDVTVTATGTIAANTIGYRGLPQNAQTGAYTLALSDAGKHISITTGGVVIPANGSIAFPVGSAVSIYNNSASSQTIAITTDTMYLAGTSTTGTRTLAQRGVATALKVGTTTWVISGGGLT